LVSARWPGSTPEQARAELTAFQATTQDLAAWEKRKATIRRGMLEPERLTKLPEKPPVDPVCTNKRTYAGYTAESVHIRSWPGFYVTGTLYRPLEGHDYGPSKRLAAYPFFIRHPGLDSQRLWAREEQINETFARIETEEEMLVFNDRNPWPGKFIPERRTNRCCFRTRCLRS